MDLTNCFLEENWFQPRNILALFIVILRPWKQKTLIRLDIKKQKNLLLKGNLVHLLVEMLWFDKFLLEKNWYQPRNRLALFIFILRTWKQKTLIRLNIKKQRNLIKRGPFLVHPLLKMLWSLQISLKGKLILAKKQAGTLFCYT